ncbi:hypothetical protein MHU86_4459 [Fragilaria crotonensis]|nr:hypothetical protein MHU86_4459 [Fragilaria crotonensis]
MEIKNLIDHDTFILGQTPHKDELIIPVKLVLKAKQTATGKLDKLKARLVARGDLEKRLLKRVKAINQQRLLEQRQEIAESTNSPGTPKPIPVEPLMYEDTWSPCASARGSNYSLQPSVHPEEVSRVLTSLVPTSKPKLLAPLCETAIGIRLSLP